MTGVDAPEAPEEPDLSSTDTEPVERSVQRMLDFVRHKVFLPTSR
jgi:adenylylsulfate kinase-like enzyme